MDTNIRSPLYLPSYVTLGLGFDRAEDVDRGLFDVLRSLIGRECGVVVFLVFDPPVSIQMPSMVIPFPGDPFHIPVDDVVSEADGGRRDAARPVCGYRDGNRPTSMVMQTVSQPLGHRARKNECDRIKENPLVGPHL